MFLHADLGRRQKPVGDGQQPRLVIAASAAIHRNGFQAKIEGGQMRAGRDARLAQDRGGEVPVEPERVLQDVERVDASGLSRSALDLQPRRMSVGHARSSSAPTAVPALHLLTLEFVSCIGDLALAISVLWRTGS